MRIILVALVSALAAGFAQAAVFDIRPANSSVTVNDAIFSTADYNTGAGSGNIDAFLRIQANGFEQGYNTDAASQDYEFDEVAGCCTHSLQLGELVTFDVGGTNYFRLDLDLNEPDGGPANNRNSWISLQEMEIYINTATGAAIGYPGSLGTKVYDLDAGEDNLIQMDAANGSQGSGDFDVNVLVPSSVLAGFGPDDYLYLFSAFGEAGSDGFSSAAGFEEWAANKNAGVIPLPAAAWLFGSALVLLGWMRRGQT